MITQRALGAVWALELCGFGDSVETLVCSG